MILLKAHLLQRIRFRRHGPRQDGNTRPGPHKFLGIECRFLNLLSSVPEREAAERECLPISKDTKIVSGSPLRSATPRQSKLSEKPLKSGVSEIAGQRQSGVFALDSPVLIIPEIMFNSEALWYLLEQE